MEAASDNIASNDMNTPTPVRKPLWITYAWADNHDGDFDYLVGELKKAGIDATYDRIALVPGRRLWEQIGDKITREDLSGWAYLITPQSIQSEPCREELSYAIWRALSGKASDFPLIGLVWGVGRSDIPPAISARLYVDLRSPDWTEQVRAALENRPPRRELQDTAPFKGQPHNAYLGSPNLRAVEFMARFGEIRNWRIAFPSAGPQPIRFGVGPANGGGVSAVLHDPVQGSSDIQHMHMNFCGASDGMTPGTSAYVVFENAFPVHMAFGWADAPNAIPKEWWPIMLGG